MRNKFIACFADRLLKLLVYSISKVLTKDLGYMFGSKFIGLFLYVIFFMCGNAAVLQELHVFDTTLSISLISKSQCFVQASILAKNLEQTDPRGSGPPL